MKRLLLAVAGLAACPVRRMRIAGGLDPSCAACHALVKPTDTSLDRLWTRKGPDLWYAGSKFNADWLTSWLQDPKADPSSRLSVFQDDHEGIRIMMFPTRPRSTPHPKLDKAAAEAATAALMALKAPADLLPPGHSKATWPVPAWARLRSISFVAASRVIRAKTARAVFQARS